MQCHNHSVTVVYLGARDYIGYINLGFGYPFVSPCHVCIRP